MQNFLVWLKGNIQPQSFNLSQIQKQFSFSYHPTIVFKAKDERLDILSKSSHCLDKQMHEMGLCYQKEILTHVCVESSIRYINDEVGYGLFAEKDLLESVYVGEYSGVVRRNDDYMNLSDYQFRYPVLDDIDRNYVVDAYHGCVTRFMNHSFSPNVKPVYAYCKGLYHVIMITTKAIYKGEQLCYDYGKQYWHIRQPPQNFYDK